MKAVIFAGGVGTRLWPMSRKKTPKQFQLLIGDKSIFQQTIERVRKGFEPEDIYISTGVEYKELVVKQAPEIPLKNLILEPERRDSLGAVAYATAYIDKYHPNSTIAAIWGADHMVEDGKVFIEALKIAGQIASDEPVICKVDARPTFPSTYNGWVEIGKPLKKINGFDVYEFVRFVEKPDIKTAHKLFRSFKYLINVGYMAWRTDTMLNLFKKHQPKLYKHISRIQDAIGTNQEQEVLADQYPKIEKDSIDYGIFEKLEPKDMQVIPADMGWTDIGTWGLLYAGLANNDEDNITQGSNIILNGKSNLVWSTQGKTITLVGVNNLVVVDSQDSILVCNGSKTGDVKELIEQLKKEKPELV